MEIRWFKKNFRDFLFFDWENVNKFLVFLLPFKKDEINRFCWMKKVKKNLKYINKNKINVLKNLKQKAKSKPLKVVFYVYDETKWKSQTVYDLMLLDKSFEPLIVVSKNCASSLLPASQNKDDILKTYNFFKERSMNVELGYDFKNDKFIPLEKFKPDIIFYSHPWYIYKTQGPVMCSKFALTYYIPYNLANTTLPIEYDLRFHQYVHKYYVLDEYLKNFYQNRQMKKSENIVAIGHPQLDYFYLNKKKTKNNTIIYAPHYTVKEGNNIGYSTFLLNGQYILDFAKKHPEFSYIFKPHPQLYKELLMSEYWTREEIDNYYNEWNKIGKINNCGDYLELFNSSLALITDCGSFLTEYLLTENPLIHLVSKRAKEFNDTVKKIVKSYYQAHNLEELEYFLNEVIIKKNDFKKPERLEALEELGLKNNYCAKKIIEDIKNDLR